MVEQSSVEAWKQRDAEFEKEFDLGESLRLRHMLGRLLGKNKPPNLNKYRDHLLEGNNVGALPVDGMPQRPKHLEQLASEDHDLLVASPGAYGLQTKFARRRIAKIAMDLQAGKISVFEDEEVDEEDEVFV